jgi:hypothetical protein
MPVFLSMYFRESSVTISTIKTLALPSKFSTWCIKDTRKDTKLVHIFLKEKVKELVLDMIEAWTRLSNSPQLKLKKVNEGNRVLQGPH